ncbi:MAG: hypothetical protein ACM31N_08425 [Deltaproteobacteria bacterium]
MRKILLLPFCLARAAQDEMERMASENGYAVVVARSTAKALAEVRLHMGPGSGEPVRIVGVVCDGRAKKVWVGLVLFSIRQWGKKAIGIKPRRIELARVPIVGGTKALFGRRSCNVGFNLVDKDALRRALSGGGTWMRL